MTALMKEPAHWFFALLNQSFKLDAEEKLKWIGIVSVPHMKKQQADMLIHSYKTATHDIIELITPHTDYSAIKRLKKEMQKDG